MLIIKTYKGESGMRNRYTTMPLALETSGELADFCGKRKSYDKGINKLLDCRENHLQNGVR